MTPELFLTIFQQITPETGMEFSKYGPWGICALIIITEYLINLKRMENDKLARTERNERDQANTEALNAVATSLATLKTFLELTMPRSRR